MGKTKSSEEGGLGGARTLHPGRLNERALLGKGQESLDAGREH